MQQKNTVLTITSKLVTFSTPSSPSLGASYAGLHEMKVTKGHFGETETGLHQHLIVVDVDTSYRFIGHPRSFNNKGSAK